MCKLILQKLSMVFKHKNQNLKLKTYLKFPFKFYKKCLD